MSTTVTMAYGTAAGPILETAKADLDDLEYGTAAGPIVGVETGGPAGPPSIIPESLGLHHLGGQF